MAEDSGLYCVTAGTYFHDKETLTEHYKSEFHRYNLKRKIAGLPPVTKEWYDARKSQLLGSLDTAAKRVWQDPLTGKKFSSENTYLAYTRSKKHQDLVRKSGQPAPAPVVTLARSDAETSTSAPEPAVRLPQHEATHTAKSLARPASHVEDRDVSSSSEWETDTEGEDENLIAVEEGEGGSAGSEVPEEEEEWEDWDVRVSLFDNHVSASLEENLEYMFKTFGFYLPDAEHLADPEGLVRYLGAKLRYGHVPLYVRGDDAEAKSFRSLHAVQRHMVDSVRCKLVYEGNEDEYADYYDWPSEDEGEETSLALVNDAGLNGGEYELAVPLSGGGTRYLGTREFARYYRQRHRAGDRRVALTKAAAVLVQYRKLAVPLITAGAQEREKARKAQRAEQQHWQRQKLAIGMSRNINDKLPKNVPY